MDHQDWLALASLQSLCPHLRRFQLDVSRVDRIASFSEEAVLSSAKPILGCGVAGRDVLV
jgi:hypothetical protein